MSEDECEWCGVGAWGHNSRCLALKARDANAVWVLLDRLRVAESQLATARAQALEEAAKSVCNYIGRCNSNRCPCRAIRALIPSEPPMARSGWTMVEISKAFNQAEAECPAEFSSRDQRRAAFMRALVEGRKL